MLSNFRSHWIQNLKFGPRFYVDAFGLASINCLIILKAKLPLSINPCTLRIAWYFEVIPLIFKDTYAYFFNEWMLKLNFQECRGRQSNKKLNSFCFKFWKEKPFQLITILNFVQEIELSIEGQKILSTNIIFPQLTFAKY